MSTNCAYSLSQRHFSLAIDSKDQIDYKLKITRTELITTKMLRLLIITLKYRD